MAKSTRTGKTSAASNILDKYERLSSLAGTKEGTKAIGEIVGDSMRFLAAETSRQALISRVDGKSYFAFRHGDGKARISRPLNESLFIASAGDMQDLVTSMTADPDLGRLSAEECNKFLYTAAISFCAFSDVTSDGDKKTPGTYFERLVGHVLGQSFGVMPRSNVEVLTVEDERTTLPTDFIFDLGPKRLKFHVPVKTSTRERAIQVWAHQRMLNGVYGEGRFKGLLVALAETKLNLDKLEVVEICTPDQWAVYQRFIARMDRIYYLDLPAKYAALAHQFPYIPVKTFGEFFQERSALTNPLSF